MARRVGGRDDRLGRRAARPHDETGALVLDLVFLKARIDDRLFHRHIVPGRAVTHEAAYAAVDRIVDVKPRRSMDLATKTELDVIFGLDDTGFCLPQSGDHLLHIVPDAGNNAETGDNNPPHLSFSFRLVLA